MINSIPILDQKTKHDPESRNFPIRPLLSAAEERMSRFWVPGMQLDQGEEGACVPHGILGEALASPVRVKVPDPQALAFVGYDWTRRNDEFPGEAYDGTSVNAGFKWGREEGWWDEYRWCFGMDDVKQTLLQHGPVVIGINWYSGMYNARNGIVQVDGKLVGGHCILLTGYSWNWNGKGEYYRWRNSWGKGYGVNGSAYIKAADLSRLLIDEQGEAGTPVVRKLR